MVDILIENGIVMTMNPGRKIFGDGAVAIEGNRIVEVGKTEEVRKRVGDAKKVINAKDKLVMPGLIDAHTHLQFGHIKGMITGNYGYGNPWIQRIQDVYMKPGRMSEENLYLSTLLTCAESIRGGSTTFIDNGGGTPPVEATAIKAVADSGMRGVLGISTEDIFEWPGYNRPESHRKLYGSAENNVRRVEGLIKKYHKSQGGRINIWPCLRQMQNSSDELLQAVKKLADKEGVGITVHANVMRPMVETVVQAWGKTPIMRLHDNGVTGRNLVIAHATHMPGEDLAAVKETDTTLVHCVLTSAGLGYGACLFANFPQWLDMGINIAVGSDGASGGNTKDMMRVMNATFLMNKEGKFDCNLWPPMRVVETATLNGARATLLEDEIGSLEPGKKADMILFDLTKLEWIPVNKYNLIENLVLSASGYSIHTSIIDGKIVMENFELKTIDEKELSKKIKEIGEKYTDGIEWLTADKPYPQSLPPLW